MMKCDGGAETPVARASLLQASCWLALILVAAKAASIDFAVASGWTAPVGLLVAASFADVIFALICGAVAQFAQLAFRKRARAAAVWRVLWLSLFAAFAIYAIAAVGIFRYFNRPLTYQLFGLIENASAVRSSIVARITWPIALAMIGTPVVFLIAAKRRAWRRPTALACVAIASLWIVSGWLLCRVGWQHEALEYLWLNPHAELLRTSALHIVGRTRPAFPKDFPAAFTDEFRTFGTRQRAVSNFHPPAGVPRPRNVIVIVLESVGTKYLGLYGRAQDLTPKLTAAAQNALVFDNIYAHASFTYASFRPINFSVYPGLPWHYALLLDARPLPQTLASVMRARGSRTAYFTSGDLDWGDQRWLLERGGDFATLQGASDLGCPLLSSWGTQDRCAFERLVDWIDERPNEPFFTVCWTDQTHDPFLSTPDAPLRDFFAGEQQPKFAADLSRYLNNLHQVDEEFGKLIAALQQRGIADDTLVVITGDHGEAFADPHGQRGHAWSVYEEEVHVPLLLWNPRLFPTGQRIPTIGGHVDLNATLADLLDVPPPNEWQGYSLFDAARPPRTYFMAIAGGDVFGVREDNWKYFYDVTSGHESLFDLASDPTEQHNAAGSQPERCRELRQRIAAWVTFEDAYLWGREN